MTNTVLSNRFGPASRVGAVPDGQGGFIGLWSLVYAQFHAQRFDAAGNPLWGATEPMVLSRTDLIGDPKIAPDNQGGFFMAWIKDMTSSELAYVQHFDNTGSPTWGESGIQVQEWVIMGTIQSEVQLVGDADGGVVVSWINDPDGDAEIYAQRISGAGSRMWSSGSVNVVAITKNNLTMVAGQNVGETYYAWQEQTAADNWDIRVQRLSGDGVSQWTQEQTELASAAGNQLGPVIACTGEDDLIVAWTDWSSGNSQVHYQRKWWSGSNGWSTDNGATWSGFYDKQEQPRITRNAAGDVFLSCLDVTESGGGRIAVQYFPEGEYSYWGQYGRTLHEDSRREMGETALVADATGGFFAVWEDYQNSTTFRSQHMNSLGEFVWNEERSAMAVSTFNYSSDEMTLIADAEGGFFAVWNGKTTATDPYYRPTGQRVDQNGFLGDNAFPVIAAVDRPNDQGGEVTLSWSPCPQDGVDTQAVASYSMWIRQPLKSNGQVAQRLMVDSHLKDADLATVLQMPEASIVALKSSGWTFVGQIPAMLADDYAALCPTYGDSTATGLNATEFKVVAHHQDSGVFWESSNMISGYSVDNLAPGAPLNLVAQATAGSVDLAWSPSHYLDDDLALYRIYRGSESGFELNAGSLLESSQTTWFQDGAFSGTAYYRITAVDAHGNEGAASNEAMVAGVTPVGDQPSAFAHRGNYPNPFNPMTHIAFDLPRAGHVRVTIYDASGHLIRTLADESMTAGAQVLRWDGKNSAGRNESSGVYFSQVEMEEFSATRRMTLVR